MKWWNWRRWLLITLDAIIRWRTACRRTILTRTSSSTGIDRPSLARINDASRSNYLSFLFSFSCCTQRRGRREFATGGRDSPLSVATFTDEHVGQSSRTDRRRVVSDSSSSSHDASSTATSAARRHPRG